MPEDRDGLLAHYARMREAMRPAIEGLSDAQMTETTIDGWSVKDHLAHIAFWDDLRAEEVIRISQGHDTAWKMTSEQDAVLNALAYEFRKGFSVAQAKWEYEVSRQCLLDALASASPRALDASLYGEAGLVSSHEEQHAGWIMRWRGERGY